MLKYIGAMIGFASFPIMFVGLFFGTIHMIDIYFGIKPEFIVLSIFPIGILMFSLGIFLIKD